MILDVVKIMLPATLAFFVGIGITPIINHYLYKFKAWKKVGGKGVGMGGGKTPIFDELHKEKEVGTPRMGGIVIWMSAFLVIVGIWALARLIPVEPFVKLDFLSRDQTWIPLVTLMIGAFVGFFDDFLEVTGKGDGYSGGLSLFKRLLVVAMLSGFVGWWFYEKLDVTSINLLFYGEFTLGLLFIPFFILITLALYAGGVIDGLDGLAGGVFAAIFAAYAAIAFYQDQINLAAFSAMIVGALLAFLWFNIPPARFFMSETGTMALTVTLAVVAFMTDSLGGGHGISVLPIVAFPLVITVASNLIQMASKKMRNGKKVFLVAPLHHHFEALGWPAYKVTMRYWVLSLIFALLGIIIAFIN